MTSLSGLGVCVAVMIEPVLRSGGTCRNGVLLFLSQKQKKTKSIVNPLATPLTRTRVYREAPMHRSSKSACMAGALSRVVHRLFEWRYPEHSVAARR